MNPKHAFVVYAGEHEPGRLFHALTHARQIHARGGEAQLYFAAEGSGWPHLLGNADHDMHALFAELREQGVIQGACENCAVAFGNKDGAEAEVKLIRGPECSYGQIDIIGLEEAGYRVWLF